MARSVSLGPRNLLRGGLPMAEAGVEEAAVPCRCAKPHLAAKGDAVPALGYDPHDAQFPFGRPVRLSLPDPTLTGPDQPGRDVVLPTAALPAITGLIAALADRDRRIATLEARLGLRPPPNPGPEPPARDGHGRPATRSEGILPFLLAMYGRRRGDGKARSAMTMAMETAAEGVQALQVDIHLTLQVLDGLADRFGASEDLARRALEALAVEEFRSGHLTQGELRRLLGLGTRDALLSFLSAQGVTATDPLDNF